MTFYCSKLLRNNLAFDVIHFVSGQNLKTHKKTSIMNHV